MAIPECIASNRILGYVSSLSPYMTTCTKNPIRSNALWDGLNIFSWMNYFKTFGVSGNCYQFDWGFDFSKFLIWSRSICLCRLGQGEAPMEPYNLQLWSLKGIFSDFCVMAPAPTYWLISKIWIYYSNYALTSYKSAFAIWHFHIKKH